MSVDDLTDPSAAVHEALLQMLVDATGTIEQLTTAVDHRTVIGQAQGIVMERLHMDAEATFAYLRRISSHSNRKLIDVARDIVRTRELPPASWSMLLVDVGT